MEQESFGGGDDEGLKSAGEMVRRAFEGEDWMNELKSKLSAPEEFLRIINSTPECEIIRDLAFNAQEGDVIEKDKFSRDLRPEGKVTIVNNERYVGGWKVDKLGFYAVPRTESPEVFDRLKVAWITTNILGARRIGENEEQYRERLRELNKKIEQYHQRQEEK